MYHLSKIFIGDYRFGFNGQEKDNEIYGEGNAYSFEYRVHDPRLGRFLSRDPLAYNFPWNSPYAFAENDVIASIEFEGLEKVRFFYRGVGVKEVIIDNMSEDEVEAMFEEYGFNYDADWYDNDAKGEVWTVITHYDYMNDPTGTYINKYATEKSYKDGKGKSYFNDVQRTFLEWATAKDESLHGEQGVWEGLKLMAITWGTILSGGGLVLAEGGATAGAIVWFSIETTVAVDEMTAVGLDDSILEEVVRSNMGDQAVQFLKGAKMAIDLRNIAKGTADISIKFLDGDKAIEFTYDILNNIVTSSQVVIDVKDTQTQQGQQ